ncbi:MAG: aldo/keto reductase, partial [Lachnospiraceae bacterium]|nr:aldo/keto reductase [Lachnospiraceae bacterium]
MQYRKDKKGDDLSILGFGCMRFQKKGGAIDIDEAEKEIMESISLGVNYFDTAYLYPGSEAAIGRIFEKNGIREKIKIATKLPQYLITSHDGIEKYFNEQLSRLRTGYVDYYLMHMLTDIAMWEKLKNVGILEWIDEKKRSGKIRNIGFSYHGNTDGFIKIL